MTSFPRDHCVVLILSSLHSLYILHTQAPAPARHQSSEDKRTEKFRGSITRAAAPAPVGELDSTEPEPQLRPLSGPGRSGRPAAGPRRSRTGRRSARPPCRQTPSRSRRHFTSASKRSIRRFVITEKAPTRAFSWLKAATTAFTFKTLLRHYAKQSLTPRSLNVKLGPRCNYHEGTAAIRHYAHQPARPS